MFLKSIVIIVLVNSLTAKVMLRHIKLHEDEEPTYHSSSYGTPNYDTPTYDTTAYEEYEDGHGTKDLFDDGKWAIKAKLLELKAVEKALKANLFSDQKKLKDLLENHMDPIKNHHHKKPVHSVYQAPPHSYQQYAPQYPHVETGHIYQQYPAQYSRGPPSSYGYSNNGGYSENSGYENNDYGNKNGYENVAHDPYYGH